MLQADITNPKTGLTGAEVSARVRDKKQNKITVNSGLTQGQIILRHCFTYFNLIFILLAVMLVISGSSVRNMTFMMVVFFNTALGIVQQIRAKRAVDKLSLVAAQKVRTLRDGKWEEIRSDLLVQDDIVEYRAGDQICADGMVLDGVLYANESLLTGEADAVEKSAGSPVLSGSFVISGTARVQLTEVGNHSFAAKLAQEAKANPHAKKSEMMASLDKLIWVMGIILIPVGALLFWQELSLLQSSLQTGAEATVAALVGMIPEGLYLLTSVALAASALKLTKDRVLVQDMNCIESLARVDVLCVDKTGTITEPEMAVEKVIPLGNWNMEEISATLTAIYGSREPDNHTAKAVQAMFPGKSDWQCSRYIPFDSRYKWCGGSFVGKGSFLVGAPEMMQMCEKTKKEAETWSRQGYRVLLAAYAPGELGETSKIPTDAEPMALILLTNPIRENAAETFRYFAQQGVAVKVLSGDHPVTVSQVALRAGIPGSEQFVDAGALTTDAAVLQAAETYTIFGRVTPQMKRRLIQAMKQGGHTVAMTGDGVNDVLALKDADCGVAMASGAQAARQVSRLVLMYSDFAAMPAIVGEGRRVINNIQRAAALFLVKNILSLILAVFCILTQMPYPFEPFHLSVVAALTIGVPGFFLAMEPNYTRVTGKFLPSVLRQALPGGLTDAVVVVLTHLAMVNLGLPLGDSAAVCTAVMAVVGLMVLFQVSLPFSWFRGVIWGSMAVALAGCFTLLRNPFQLMITDSRSYLVLLVALLAAPTVFLVWNRIFALADKGIRRWRRADL